MNRRNKIREKMKTLQAKLICSVSHVAQEEKRIVSLEIDDMLKYL